MGLRNELGEVLLRHARARATELLGRNQATAQEPPLAHLTGRIERLIRADAAIAAALRDAETELISHPPDGGEYMASIAVGAVMKELGVPFQQAAELAQTVMKD